MPSPATRPPRGKGCKGGNEGAVVAPFAVQIDKREQRPYAFVGLKTDARDGSRPLNVPLYFESMVNGDYSIVGYTDRLGLERKSKEDLFGSVGRRKNFEGRLERMTEIRERLGWRESYFAVVVEADLEEIRTDPPRFSKIPPKSLNRTIMAWRQRYLVDWWFVASRIHAENFTFRLLERFYRDHPHHAQHF